MDHFDINISDYQNSLCQIENYIKTIEIQKEVLLELNNEFIILDSKDTFIKTKEYKENLNKILNSSVQYNAVIITMYGCYESFLDNVLDKYISLLFKNVVDYKQLPEKLQEKHIRKTGDFLLNNQRYVNYELTIEEAVENISNCLKNDSNKKLSNELLLSHGGNLRIKQVVDLLNELGILSAEDKILNNELYIEFYSKRSGLTLEEAKKHINQNKSVGNQKLLFNVLESLVDERNKVAHGRVIENRISFSVLMEDYIEFLRIFGIIITSILVNEFYFFLFKDNKLKKFDKPIDVFNNNILCINSLDSFLSVNDLIFSIIENDFKVLRILEIQINREKCNSIDIENVDVGLKLDESIKKNWDFYFIKS